MDPSRGGPGEDGGGVLLTVRRAKGIFLIDRQGRHDVHPPLNRHFVPSCTPKRLGALEGGVKGERGDLIERGMVRET